MLKCDFMRILVVLINWVKLAGVNKYKATKRVRFTEANIRGKENFSLLQRV